MSLRKNSPTDPQHAVAKAAADADAPMTPDQIEYLKELWRRAGDADAFDENLTRGEAQKRIAALETLLEHERDSGVDRLPRT
ncbi:MAG TPA: DUF3072 domain-containing protein [Xanthobacteraceae bacterium]|nr:DUF3072 domain-containing protein [Xanthobacteraceae bacterium]